MPESIDRSSGGIETGAPTPISETAPSVRVRPEEADESGVSSLRKSEQPMPINKAASPAEPSLAPPRPFMAPTNSPPPPLSAAEQELLESLGLGDSVNFDNLVNSLGNIQPNVGATASERLAQNVNQNFQALDTLLGTASEMVTQAMRMVSTPSSDQAAAPTGAGGTDIRAAKPVSTASATEIQMDSLSNEDKASLLGFLIAMGRALSDMQASRTATAIDLTNLNAKMTEKQKDMKNVQGAMLEKGIYKMLEGAKMATALKVLGPIIITLTAAASIATLGSSTPLLVVAITLFTTAVGSALSIADSVTGFMSKGISEGMKKMIPGDGPGADAARSAFLMALVIVAVAIMRSGVSKIASSAAAQEVAKVMPAMLQSGVNVDKAALTKSMEQTIASGIRSATSNFLVTFAMLSGATTGLVEGPMKAVAKTGAGNDGVNAALSAFMQIVLVTGIIAACVATRGKPDLSIAQKAIQLAKKSFETTAQKSQQIIKGMAIVTQSASAGVNITKGQTVFDQKQFEAASQVLRDGVNALKEAASPEVVKQLLSGAQQDSELFGHLQELELAMTTSLSRPG
jgi:hypothetical protein